VGAGESMGGRVSYIGELDGGREQSAEGCCFWAEVSEFEAHSGLECGEGGEVSGRGCQGMCTERECGGCVFSDGDARGCGNQVGREGGEGLGREVCMPPVVRRWVRPWGEIEGSFAGVDASGRMDGVRRAWSRKVSGIWSSCPTETEVGWDNVRRAGGSSSSWCRKGRHG